MEFLRKVLKEQLNLRYPNEQIVSDGILKEELFEKQAVRVMFVLKESYGGYNNIIGPQEIFNGKSAPFWTNIYNWSKLVNDFFTGEEPLFLSKNRIGEKTANVDNIAYVNIKKINQNKSVSGDQDILNFAKRDKDLLQIQIDQINPDVLFTSNITFEGYKEIYGLGNYDFKNYTSVQCKNQYFIYAEHKKRKILKIYHPSSYGIAQNVTFSGIVELLRKVQ